MEWIGISEGARFDDDIAEWTVFVVRDDCAAGVGQLCHILISIHKTETNGYLATDGLFYNGYCSSPDWQIDTEKKHISMTYTKLLHNITQADFIVSFHSDFEGMIRIE